MIVGCPIWKLLHEIYYMSSKRTRDWILFVDVKLNKHKQAALSLNKTSGQKLSQTFKHA
jgi:hypothetical protein